MKTLANTETISHELLYKLWLRKLPQIVQAHLTTCNSQNIDERVSLADRIYEISSKRQVSAVEHNSRNNIEFSIQQLTELTANLCQNLNKVILEVGELKYRGRSQERNNSNNRNFSRRRSNSRNNTEFCWYHSRFGDRAYKCIKPCNFENKNVNNSLN